MKESTLIMAEHLVNSVAGLTTSNVHQGGPNWKMPPTPGVFVVVQLISQKVIANNYEEESTTGGMQERITTQYSDLLQIDVFSRDNSCKSITQLIVASLAGYKMNEKSLKEGFRVAYLPTITQAYIQDGADMIKRYVVTVPIFRVNEVTSTIPYYDDFRDPEIKSNGPS